MQITLSTNQCPEMNAAYEELLFRKTPRREAHLFMYVNRPAVLIGRNQNPWAECDLDYCQKHGITILRRLSGGGTVYHDLNNLNVALILPRQAYDPEKLVRLLITALTKLGVGSLYHNDHYSIFSHHRKLCGTAFALSTKAALLHACILVNTDLNRLKHALRQPPDLRITGTGVGSNRMPVTKVTDIIPNITIQDVALEIIRQARRTYRKLAVSLVGPNCPRELSMKFYEHVRKFRDPKWTYGHTNDFVLEKTLPEGLLKLTVASGFISSAQLYTMSGKQIMIPTLTGLPLATLRQNLNHHMIR